MKFEEALDLIVEKKKAISPSVREQAVFNTIDDLKIAAAIWNMIAIAQSEKGLDDFIVIDNNNNMMSIPLKGKAKNENPDKNDEKNPPESPKSKKKDKGLVNEQKEPEKEPGSE